MAHCVQAFIGSRISLEKIQKQFSVSKVVDLKQELALLPLLDELFDAIPNEENTDLVEKNFQFLTRKIIDLLIQNSENEHIGYFETEFFGGIGDQGAVLAKEGKIFFGPLATTDCINEVLKLMGVKKADAFDEFDAVGLGRYRNNEDWINQPVYRKG